MNDIDEKIIALAERKCAGSGCVSSCVCFEIKDRNPHNCINWLSVRCAELIRERRENPGVWDGAPSFANMAQVSFLNDDGYSSITLGDKQYRRTPPKDAKRLLAERIENAIKNSTGNMMADIIERELRKEL